MILFPAIDIYNNMAVRLLRGEYNQMTVYNPNPAAVAKQLEAAGATHIHMVDLEGARDGDTPNRDIICAIASSTPCFVQVGGGIRSLGTIERYVEGGVDRVILGTAAVTQEGFVKEAVKRYGDKIAVGVDIKDGKVAIKGWRETSEWGYEAFCRRMEEKEATGSATQYDNQSSYIRYRKSKNRFSCKVTKIKCAIQSFKTSYHRIA